MGLFFIFIIPTILILIGLWFLSKFIISKIKFLDKKLTKVMASLLLTFVLYALFISILLIVLFTPKKEVFDAQKWNKTEQVRYRMIDNLIKDEILIGMDTIEVKNTIGKPNKINKNSRTWSYVVLGIGVFDFFYIDLIVTFENNKVIDVEKK